MDGNNNARGYSHRDLTNRMEEGSRFFSQSYFAGAAVSFRHARDASIQIHGESSLECAIARYSRGLSLLCQIPVPINDPMAFVSKEVDYYSSVIPFPSAAFQAYRGALDENYVRILEDAKGELNLAWSIMEYRIDNYLLKANILSALGEVAYRMGESNPQRYYFEASSIFDTWLGENSKRVADIYVKLLICLEGSDKSKAIACGYKAMSIYRALYEKLSSETGTADQRRGSSSVARTDPFIQPKRDVAQQLCNMITNLEHKVAENRCWSCGLACQSHQDLQNHLHETAKLKDIKPLWDDEKYLKPVMQDDPLLYSFNDDEEGEDNHMTPDDQEELVKYLRNIDEMCIEDTDTLKKSAHGYGFFEQNGAKEVASSSSSHENVGNSSKMEMLNGDSEELVGSSDGKPSDKHSKASIMNLLDKDIKKANENYFGAYSSFGIHREMISDKVRMNAYSQAILKNPSLMTGAVVMDVGCGTGILSLFAAKTGASRVIAIEASEKMASVATQIAKENGLWRCTEGNNQYTGVMEVVQGMVEEIDKSIQIEPHSVDVLLSEWMGYCLLYETMLSSVLFARDKWLKPGGAILPDTASIYAAGFGRGGTSIPFWEEVYGFNMSCVGKELVQDAAKFPIVDVVDEKDLVTDAVLLQAFDLTTMKPDEVDFTASIELEPKSIRLANNSTELSSETTWCYGVVLWFDTGFTPRFCKETTSVLSTSPYTPKTHWSQTIFTFNEPIAMAPGKPCADKSTAVGTDACPASRIHLRISIARAVEHRSIDISIETSGVDLDGRKRCWPVQMFNLS